MSASVWVTLIPIASAIFVAFVGYRTYSCLYSIPPLPELKEIWWGPGDAKSAKLDTTIKPFKINVPDEVSLKSFPLNRTYFLAIYRSSPYGYFKVNSRWMWPKWGGTSWLINYVSNKIGINFILSSSLQILKCIFEMFVLCHWMLININFNCMLLYLIVPWNHAIMIVQKIIIAKWSHSTYYFVKYFNLVAESGIVYYRQSCLFNRSRY